MNKSGWFIICIFTFFALTISFPCFAQNKIIAVVNNEAITQKDLDDFMAFMRIQLSEEFKGRQLEDKIASMKQEFIERLIEDRIILQEAKKNKATVDEARVKARVIEIKDQYPSESMFEEALRMQGLVQADIESKVRDQMLTFGIIENKVRSKIVVSPAEVTDFYQMNPDSFKSPQVWEFDFMALESKDLAEEISQAVKKGRPLEELSAKYSLSLNKLSTKDGQFKKDAEDVLLKLKGNEVSAPVKIEDKYYIFRLNKIIPPRQLSLSEAQEKIYAYLFGKKMQENLAKWLDELKKQSYIKIIN